MIRQDTAEFGDSLVRAQTQQKLKITERVAAYNCFKIVDVMHIYEREEEQCKWSSYQRGVHKYHIGICKASYSKGNSSF